MSKISKKVAIFMSLVLAVGTMSVSAFAAPGEGEAGIKFEVGGTDIIDPPTTDLNGIENGDIDFGEQELSGSTKTYNSVDEGAAGKKHAGFAVSASHFDGWEINVSISDFEINGVTTMENYELVLTPWTTGPVTTSDNTTAAAAPVAKTVTLAAGQSDSIFEAEENYGHGIWGCNWEGDLTVAGGSAQEGTAKATMLWSVVQGA